MQIRAIIVDDEKLARSRLKHLLQRHKQIEVIGEAVNGKEGVDLVRKTSPDVIFLDIKMPVTSGFEMLRGLDKSPYVIFTTAYDEFALRAFEENTIDYLLKPVSEEAMDRAISKLTDFLKRGKSVTIDLERLARSMEEQRRVIRRFSVTAGNKIVLIPEDEIYFFNAEDKYTFLNTRDHDFIVSFPIKDLENRLDPAKFVRVHRSYVVNLNFIESVNRWFGGKLLVKMKNGKEITVSRGYMASFKRKISL
ncbi:MAG: LytTR family DNA-binding domain-containing protein [Candidatus Eisenbacteria bacterium]|nr:LytTR family DNA-binding domain-containing protein [Candidatus Eisenbacteria bacterium]